MWNRHNLCVAQGKCWAISVAIASSQLVKIVSICFSDPRSLFRHPNNQENVSDASFMSASKPVLIFPPHSPLLQKRVVAGTNSSGKWCREWSSLQIHSSLEATWNQPNNMIEDDSHPLDLLPAVWHFFTFLAVNSVSFVSIDLARKQCLASVWFELPRG